MKNLKQYYKELGKAVYAVAITDGVITPEERATLHHFVLKDLVRNESHEDSSNMNEAFYVDFEFDEAAAGKYDADAMVKSFVNFVHTNYEKGDDKLIERSLHVLSEVSSAYSRSKEKDRLHEIKAELKEVHR